ncbi:MAG TPA: MFS transporter [Solirubrobacteraceae bacterium]|nr:MFS transporter [Solirubrobacteraceae bacterium]
MNSVRHTYPKRWQILFVILAAECMDLLDGTVVNVAAPSIHRDLDTSSTGLQWIVGGYPLALAAGLLIGGRLGDLFGRRRMFLIGVVGFTAASTLCGLAPTTAVLIAARLVQGLAGAMMIPQGLGVIREVFPAEELPKAFGLFGPVMGSAALLGPIIGGGLVSLNLLGDAWRPVFLVNVPLGLLATFGAARLLPRIAVRHADRLDVVGAVLAAVASLAIVYPLIEGRALGWPAWTYASIAGGVVLFGTFAGHLLRLRRLGRDPLVEPSIFAHRGYSAGALVLMLYFGAMIGVVLALTLFLQLGEHFSAVHAGLTLAPFALGTAISAPAGAVLADRVGGRVLIQLGALVSLLSNVGLALILTSTTHVSTWGLTGPLLAYGVGMGLFLVPAFDTIIAAVGDAETGSASGTLNAIQQLGGAIGVAVLGTVFFSVLSHHGFAVALRETIWWQVAGLGLVLVVSPLLPARARVAAAEMPSEVVESRVSAAA